MRGFVIRVASELVPLLLWVAGMCALYEVAHRLVYGSWVGWQ